MVMGWKLWKVEFLVLLLEMWRIGDARFGVRVVVPRKRIAHAGYLESRQYMRRFYARLPR